MKMQNLRLSTFLGLLIYLFVASYAVAKPLKGVVIFTRGGIVLELGRASQDNPSTKFVTKFGYT